MGKGVPKEAYVPSSTDDSTVFSLNTSTGAIKLDQSVLLSNTDTTNCIIIGRNESASLRVAHGSIGRQHAAFYYKGSSQLFLKDMGSKYGTTLNGEKLEKEITVELKNGDSLFFGKLRDTIFTVSAPKINEEIEISFKSKEPSVAVDEDSSEKKSENQSELIPHAGDGLEGRAKREAEIKAMVASLGAVPVYKTTKETTTNPSEEGTGDEDAKKATVSQMAKKYKLPLTRRLDLPAENAAKSNELLCLAIEPSGARFCTGGRDTRLRIYDFGGLQHVRLGPFCELIPEDGHWIVDAAFGGKQQLIVATGGVQPQILNRDGQEVVKFVRGDSYVTDPTKTKGHTASVTGVDWHPTDSNLVATSSMDGSVRLWKLNGPTVFQMLTCHKVSVCKSRQARKTGVTAVAFSPGGKDLAVGTVCGSLQFWNPFKASSRPVRAIFQAHFGPIHGLEYSRDGRFLATRSPDENDSAAKVWKATAPWRGKPLVECHGLPTLYERPNAALSPDSAFLVAGSAERVDKKAIQGKLHVYRLDLDTQMSSLETKVLLPLFSIDLDVPPTYVSWHMKLNQIIVAGANGSVSVWYSPKMSTNGAKLVKAGKPTDELTLLLQEKAPTGSAAYVGEILAPLDDEPHRRKRKLDPTETLVPERPAAKKLMGSQAGGATTFQQFVADQQRGRLEKDPRKALFKYDAKDGSELYSTPHQPKILAETTAEQEAEADKVQK